MTAPRPVYKHAAIGATTSLTFRCEPLNARLTRESCAARHTACTQKHDRSACDGCLVGEKHAAGERPTNLSFGRRQPLVSRHAKNSNVRRDRWRRLGRCPECGAEPAPDRKMCARHLEERRVQREAHRRREGAKPKPRRYLTHEGRTQTVAAWAREVGVAPPTILYRLGRGWPIERVLSGPTQLGGPKRKDRCGRGHDVSSPDARYRSGNCKACADVLRKSR